MTAHPTPVSLLDRLRSTPEPGAWERFVALYAPLLFAWTARLGLDDHDAADLVQDVFASLVEALPRFRYDAGGSFRAWLKTVLLNRWRERLRKAGRQGRPAPGGLDGVAARDDPLAGFEEAEYRRYLAQRALAIMQADYQPATWQACWLSVVEGVPAAEVAERLGLTVNAVYLAKARILRRLREELGALLD